jgi:hypothetical protein
MDSLPAGKLILPFEIGPKLFVLILESFWKSPRNAVRSHPGIASTGSL